MLPGLEGHSASFLQSMHWLVASAPATRQTPLACSSACSSSRYRLMHLRLMSRCSQASFCIKFHKSTKCGRLYRMSSSHSGVDQSRMGGSSQTFYECRLCSHLDLAVCTADEYLLCGFSGSSSIADLQASFKGCTAHSRCVQCLQSCRHFCILVWLQPFQHAAQLTCRTSCPVQLTTRFKSDCNPTPHAGLLCCTPAAQ